LVSSSYIVKRFIKASDRWDPIALYDSNNNFRGEAVFESRHEAQNYLEIYRSKMDNRLSFKGNPKTIKQRLKVFEEEDSIEEDV
jgi:hypothetical protein